MTAFVAHVRIGKAEKFQIHEVKDHLQKVAELAARFAGKRGSVFARYAGLLHDLGKFQAAFQDYIERVSGFKKEDAHLENLEERGAVKIPHSTAGAKYAVGAFDPFFGHLLAYLIAGHHAGLADWNDKGSLKHRLQQADNELENALLGAQEDGLDEQFQNLSDDDLLADFQSFFSGNEKFAAELHIWVRFLFSCLVDADFLDTEAFMNGYADAEMAKQAGLRPSFPELSELHSRYQAYMEALLVKADKTSALNQERNQILMQCFQSAEWNESLFALTVPTGGGKTLASLGFALKHALKFDKRRIIYAIPFTSIIEQNASVFRKVLGGM